MPPRKAPSKSTSSLPLEQDPRWLRLTKRGYFCPTCKDDHCGIYDLGCMQPYFWEGSPEPESNADLPGRDNILTEDFCIVEGKHFFVRCVLRLPIIGSKTETFGYGVWSSLSQANFERYVDTFDDGSQGKLGPWFGWFASSLEGYPDTLNLKCQVCLRDDRQRPFIQMERTDHLLAVEQREGITFERLLDLYALNGHDVRPALSAQPD